jgi:hypothetical protein
VGLVVGVSLGDGDGSCVFVGTEVISVRNGYRVGLIAGVIVRRVVGLDIGISLGDRVGSSAEVLSVQNG